MSKVDAAREYLLAPQTDKGWQGNLCRSSRYALAQGTQELVQLPPLDDTEFKGTIAEWITALSNQTREGVLFISHEDVNKGDEENARRIARVIGKNILKCCLVPEEKQIIARENFAAFKKLVKNDCEQQILGMIRISGTIKDDRLVLSTQSSHYTHPYHPRYLPALGVQVTSGEAIQRALVDSQLRSVQALELARRRGGRRDTRGNFFVPDVKM